jgi:hypothetical protein
VTGQRGWRKSSFSSDVNLQCVEVRGEDHEVLVRDSTRPGGRVLRCSPDAWRAFLAHTSSALPRPA